MPDTDINKKETLEALLQKEQELSLQKSLLVKKHLESDNPEEILKAKAYIEQNKNNTGNLKSYFFSPNNEYYDSNGYKQPTKGVTFELLRNMGKTPVIASIIGTRVDQVKRFNTFTIDGQKEGWTIRKKLGRFEDSKDFEPTDKDKTIIDKIATFIENSGENDLWDNTDDFQEFLDQVTRDSLELDQGVFECERNRAGDLVSYKATDGALIRLLETIDDKKEEQELIYRYKDIKGFYPRYCQVWNNEIIVNEQNERVIYYPWELGYVVRNKTSNIRKNGYGVSELEILIEIVTWLLWGMQYNGNFFKQGSAPRGFFTLEGSGNQNTVDQFKQMWRNMMSGTENSHKTPFFSGQQKIEWHEMGGSNKDMEYQNWNDFLMLIACSVYKIDPSELGYNLQRQSQMFGQDGQRERLDHSKDKGLKPLLKVLQKNINKYIVTQLDTSYEFVFTGIDLEDETEILDNDIKKVSNGFASMEDLFEKHSGRKFNENKDTILNPVYWQAQQSKQFGGEESNAAVDQMTGEPDEGVQNPFDEYAKGEEPIFNKAMDYIKNADWR